MTREEQIRSAAFDASTKNDDYKKYAKDGIARMFFVEGAQWADENPKSPWISVEERLPEIGTTILEAYTIVVEFQGHTEETETVVLTKYDGDFIGDGSIEHMMDGTTCSTTHHWMPIPELPKGG